MLELAVTKLLQKLKPAWLAPFWERIGRSPLGCRLAGGAVWSICGGTVSRGLGLIASIFVARVLGKQGFGEFGVIQSTVAMFATFAGFGLGLTATRHVAEFRVRDPERAGRIIGLSSLLAWLTGTITALILVVLAPTLATHALAAPHLSRLLQMSSFLLLLGAINGAQLGSLTGFESFRLVAKVNVAAAFVSFPIILGGVYMWGIDGALCGMVASQAATCVLFYWALRTETRRYGVPVRWKGAVQELRMLKSFTLPAVLSGAMFGPVNWICCGILVNQPEGYIEMGVFNAANQWRQAILFIPVLLSPIALPMLASLQGEGEVKKSRKVLKALAGVSLLSSMAVALPIIAMARPIMGSYGESFVSGAGVLVILCFSSMIMAVLNVAGQALVSESRMWLGFALNGIWGIALISLSLLLRGHGAKGFALANLGAYSIHFITVTACIYSRMHNLRVDHANETVPVAS